MWIMYAARQLAYMTPAFILVISYGEIRVEQLLYRFAFVLSNYIAVSDYFVDKLFARQWNYLVL